MFRKALALREAARARLPLPPDGVDLIAPRSPLARLVRENSVACGPKAILNRDPFREAAAFETAVVPGALYRLSIAHRTTGPRPRYDHTRECPLIRFPDRAAAAMPRLGVPALEDSTGTRRFVIEIPPGLRRLRIGLSFPLPGEYEVDQVALERLSPP